MPLSMFITIFFISKGVFPKIWGHPTHSIGSTHKAKQIKSIHSFNCFIKPASPWIIYVAPPMIRLHSLLSFTHSSASGMLSPLSLKQPFTPSITFSLVYLSPCYPRLLLDISFSLTSLPPFF